MQGWDDTSRMTTHPKLLSPECSTCSRLATRSEVLHVRTVDVAATPVVLVSLIDGSVVVLGGGVDFAELVQPAISQALEIVARTKMARCRTPPFILTL